MYVTFNNEIKYLQMYDALNSIIELKHPAKKLYIDIIIMISLFTIINNFYEAKWKIDMEKGFVEKYS